MRRTKEGLAASGVRPGNLRVLESFEPEKAAPSPTATSGQWTVVDTNGSPRGRVTTRSEAVRLMSTLAGRMPRALPLRVMDCEGHETGDRLA